MLQSENKIAKDTCLTVSNLVVLDFQSARISKNVLLKFGEEATNNNLLRLESCARQLFILPQEFFNRLPEEIRDNPTFYKTGAAAYSHLIQIISGATSERTGEDHMICRSKQSFDVFKMSHTGEVYETFFQQMLNDVKGIRTRIMHNLRKEDRPYTTKYILQPKRGESALIVVGAPTLTIDVIKAVAGSKSNNRFTKLFLCGSDPAIVNEVFNEIKALKKEKRLPQDLTKEIVNINDLKKREINKIAHFIVCSKMTSPGDPLHEQDRKILNLWKERNGEIGFLIHVKGDPNNRELSNDYWLDKGEHRSIILPENIWAEIERTKISNRAIIEKVSEVAVIASLARLVGKPINWRQVEL